MTIAVADALGDVVRLPRPARRVVSLVPSVTETLFALGRGASLIGCTGFCLHPAEALRSVPKIGGTKDPDLASIAALAPDLILANKEENRREDVEALRATAPVHVSYPRSIDDVVAYLGDLGAMLGAEEAAQTECEALRRARSVARDALAGGRRRPRALYLIWRKPWMAAAGDTFIHAMLQETGFENVLADAPGRYPETDLARCAETGVEVLLLSSEPFPFDDRHRSEAAEASGLPIERVLCVSGEAFSWFGCRSRTAFAEAARVRSALGF